MSTRFTRPYVDAFFAVATDPAAEVKALEAFQRTYDEAPELGKVLSNPGLDRETRERLLDDVASRVGVPVVGARLLRILLHNHRLRVLGELLAAFRARLDKETHTVEARVATALPADAEVLDALRALVAERTNNNVRVVPVVDSALLGGFVVSVGSARLDASLARRLENARAALHARTTA